MSDSDIVQDFLVESSENLDRLNRELVGLEKNPHDRDALSNVFRTIHTIKGTCGFLGFNKLEKVAHVGENLLTRLRDGQLTLNPELTTTLLGMGMPYAWRRWQSCASCIQNCRSSCSARAPRAGRRRRWMRSRWERRTMPRNRAILAVPRWRSNEYVRRSSPRSRHCVA